MLDPQVVVNLLLELGVGVDLVRHHHWIGERFKCDPTACVTSRVGECALV